MSGSRCHYYFQKHNSHHDCRNCVISLQVGVNWSASRKANGDYICNGCASERARENKEHRKASLFERQGLMCAICERTSKDRAAFHLDHCHRSGKHRGVLCSGCNQTLGLMMDNPAWLRRAAEYLEQVD
ncbi:endonuclease VII domain-containing protein [Teichococcus vastitatis]|uniref:Endonuclease VII domain-containing protein n=1 Tax=Teichococcus vastitatis TaxID=2307076 RepID=A0ABS9WBK3_9PROT|nr:endonuclease VII domain-containing protein [Pseudoroseomonas vastitatis]MCI0756682.1 endonuclease VII domain-containing protein [Pseudoroseomonas vastitatis]